jgi:hypothetical protein
MLFYIYDFIKHSIPVFAQIHVKDRPNWNEYEGGVHLASFRPIFQTLIKSSCNHSLL